jgi:hypothetical protein
MIDVRAIRQKQVDEGAHVLVEAIGLERDFLPKGEARRNAFAPHLLGQSTRCVTHSAAVTTKRWVSGLAGQGIVEILEYGLAYLGGTGTFVARTANGTDAEIVGLAEVRFVAV